MKKVLVAFCLCAVGLFAKSNVSVSILPQEYFVKKIAGDTVNVNVMVAKGSDPHTYEPKPKQMKELEKSDLYFAIGIEFEHSWLPKFNKLNPKMRIVFTQKDVELIKMVEHEEHHTNDKHDKDAHHEEEHHHDGFDPHIWLDPILVKTQAKNIADALITKYPENKALYEQNLKQFNDELDALDGYIKKSFEGLKNRDFMVYHPSWGYFAKRYDLNQFAVEIEGKEPKPSELKELVDEAKEHDIKVIFIAPQFSKKAAEVIAKESNAKVVAIDQLSSEWESELRKSTDSIANSLK